MEGGKERGREEITCFCTSYMGEKENKVSEKLEAEQFG